MTMLKGLLATAAAAAMLTATTAGAATSPAQSPLTATPARAAATTSHDSRIGAEVPTVTLLSIGVLAALVVLVLVLTGQENDAPNSP